MEEERKEEEEEEGWSSLRGNARSPLPRLEGIFKKKRKEDGQMQPNLTRRLGNTTLEENEEDDGEMDGEMMGEDLGIRETDSL